MTSTSTTPPDVVDSWPALRAWRLAMHGSPLKPSTKLLGLLLADHINGKTWQAWPSQVTLARLGGDAQRHRVRERIAELVTAGWVKVVRPGGPGRSARYALTRMGTKSVPIEPVPIESVPTENVPAMGTDLVPSMGTDLVPRSPRKSEGLSEGLQRGTKRETVGADPARPPADRSPRPRQPQGVALWEPDPRHRERWTA